MDSRGRSSSHADDNNESILSRKRIISSTQSADTVHQTPKRPRLRTAVVDQHDHLAHNIGKDGQPKRVWKACKRCRMRKTKCDGELPCRRCKDDGSVCLAGIRKKIEYKRLPKGYGEVLERTQLTLVATIHKLYSMVRSGQQWELGEPGLSDRNQPVVHKIAQKLGCIQPHKDAHLPIHTALPGSKVDVVDLACQLEDEQKDQEPQEPQEPPRQQQQQYGVVKDTMCSVVDRPECASSLGIDHSDVGNYYNAAFGGSAMTVSPQSLNDNQNFDFIAPGPEMYSSSLFFPQLPATPNFPAWSINRHQPDDLIIQFLQQVNVMKHTELPDQSLIEAEFGIARPPILTCSNLEVITTLSDPMIHPGYDGELLQL
ncbi:hypothetical protein BGZ63DRAFT_454788 [Mariannaea sp. PMI_226]|nr:hypothetical protein BGZ63DRAFT_454788 [Mariannaea sp. PMI_226]